MTFFNNTLSPTSTAITFNNRIISYQELKRKVNNAANFILRESINDNVVIFADNNLQYIVALLGAWQGGKRAFLLNVKLTKAEVDPLIDFIKPGIILTEDKYQYLFNSSILLDLIDGEDDTPEIEGDNDGSLVIFTSGTESKPKGVLHTTESIKESIIKSGLLLDNSGSDKWVATLPFYHIGGLMTALRPLYNGGMVVIPKSLKYQDIYNSIRETKPSYISLVTPQLQHFVDNNMVPPGSLKYSLIGGGFISDQLYSAAIVNNWKPAKVYGSSETASFITAHTYRDPQISGSVGKPLKGNKIKIVDSNNKELPKGSSGDIWVKCSSLFKEYINNPAETDSKFYRGWYITGDVGFIEESGCLVVLARREDLIITGGENIYPAEIESVIMKFPGVKQVSVLGIKDDKWGHSVVAAVVADEKINDQLIVFMKKNLASFKIPKRIIYLNEIPKNISGKINREELKRLFQVPA